MAGCGHERVQREFFAYRDLTPNRRKGKIEEKEV
jgi:hypothetical protein